MPRDKRAKIVAAARDKMELEDRISALPDGVFQHLLGFLPADEAVRTCVLARHWRHQWRSVRHLRIDCDMPWSNEDFVKFANRLLLLRAPGMALDEFEVSSEYTDLDPEVEEETHIWIRHALMCKVRAAICPV
ncbi:F-box/LRR-repeat protein At3g59200-like [Miscanthus floridulus]|uniref:F-box/LRR-repeat protein At3g59200-like n=1 Tax=Miscanthus floridulus TaxID=154761 RepID=UPI00345A7493